MTIKTVTPLSRYRMTTDGIAVNSDFLLTNISITGDGVNHGKAVLHCGKDSGGQIILTLRVLANKSEKFTLDPGISCKDGLYVDLTTADEVIIFGYVLNP